MSCGVGARRFTGRHVIMQVCLTPDPRRGGGLEFLRRCVLGSGRV